MDLYRRPRRCSYAATSVAVPCRADKAAARFCDFALGNVVLVLWLASLIWR